MALIGKIRNNMWLVIILLALGLGGFVFMDISSVGGMGGGANQFNVGSVNGNDIPWFDFQRAQDALYSGSTADVNSQRDFVWTYFVEDAILRNEAEALGLSVGTDEMDELQFGARLSPVVQRNFTDPQTGQVNRESLNSFREAARQGTLAPEYKRIWDFQQEEVRKERIEAKLVNLVKKSIYTPTWMVEEQQNANGMSVDFRYVMIPFDQVADSEIKVTDADYSAYLREHSALYDRQMEMRDARYVVFDVFPTAEDSLAIREDVEELITQFKATDDDSIFVSNLNGELNARFFKASELPAAIADTIFSIPVDSIYGPYVDNGAYRAAKVIGIQMVPDSVRARHILLQVRTQEEVPAALMMADSLERLLARDITQFDTLAKANSQDGGSAAKGGDLGYVALDLFVKPMNDLLFYGKTEPKKVYRVLSEFGIHLVEVLDRKYETKEMGVRLGIISEAIVPSKITQDELYDDALEFAGQNRTLDALRKSVESRGDLILEESKNLAQSSYNFGTLGSSNTSREIVRWLFAPDTKKGAVAPTVFVIEDNENYFNSQYVVVALEAIHPKGLATVASVKDVIEAPVKNKKRGEYLVSKIKTNDLSALASQFGVAVDSVENVNFGIYTMRNIGDEPQVLATATKLQEGQKSGPIVGKNGVFVVEVTKRIEAPPAANIPQMRRQASFQMANSAEFELMSALKRSAKIQDNRYTFF